MKSSDTSSPFEKTGFYFLGILLVTITGFLIPFMSTWSDPGISHPPVIHIHAGFMSLWLALIIIQPFFIQLKWKNAHRILGNSSYVLFPLLCLGIIHLTISSLPHLESSARPVFLGIQVMDLVILLGCYTLGMIYRKTPALHARFMIGSAIPIAEPGLTRTLTAMLPVSESVSRGISFGILLLILLWLLFKDWKNKEIRWVFTSVFTATFLLAGLALFGNHVPFWHLLVDWLIMG